MMKPLPEHGRRHALRPRKGARHVAGAGETHLGCDHVQREVGGAQQVLDPLQTDILCTVVPMCQITGSPYAMRSDVRILKVRKRTTASLSGFRVAMSTCGENPTLAVAQPKWARLRIAIASRDD